MEKLFETARYFTGKTDCTLIGSLCLYMLAPELLGRLPNDVDLFADNNEDNIRKIISLMEERGFEVFSWQDRIDKNVPMSLLRGRYYIRGICDGLTVDVTYEEGELELNRTCNKKLQVQTEGKRQVKREVPYYNLKMIIAIGYRVKSSVATSFRKWANDVIEEFMKKGFVLDDKRLEDPSKFGHDYL